MAAEKRFENKLKDFLKANNHWYIKYWAGAEYTRYGIPDILACINGKFYGIEVKAKNGKPSALQLVNLRNVRSSGGIGVLLYPEDFDYFLEFINDTELGKHWYRSNITLQRTLMEKLNA